MAPRAKSDRAPHAGAARHVCPVCQAHLGPDRKLFPFCSDRCKLIDLGRWLGGRYRIEIPVETATEDLSEDEPSDPDLDAEGKR